MKKEKHHYNFFVHIHTMCIKSDIALLTEKEINQKRYMKRFSFAGGKAIYIINPNKYENGIMDVAGLKRVVGEITNDLVLTEYDIDRVDIAIDTNIPYEKLYKINSYLKELYAEHINQANSYYTNGADLTKRSLRVSSRSYELEIYNKAEESKGKNPVQTRIEFRLKRMRKNNNIDDAINAVICALESLPDCIGLLSSKKIEQLSNRYIYEQAADYEGRLTAFSSFVCKYADFIYNIDILKGLHNRFGTRSCKEWLYSYRKQGKTLTLYGKGDIIEYLTAITKSLQAYSKSSI